MSIRGPEPCLAASFCMTPSRCDAYGYCSKRNSWQEDGIPDEKTRERWKQDARERLLNPPMPETQRRSFNLRYR